MKLIRIFRPGRVPIERTYASGTVRIRLSEVPSTVICMLFQTALRKFGWVISCLYASMLHFQGGMSMPKLVSSEAYPNGVIDIITTRHIGTRIMRRITTRKVLIIIWKTISSRDLTGMEISPDQ
jgi:hypothetical protein